MILCATVFSLHRESPGPGTYLPALQKSEQNVRFGTSVRKKIDYSTASPGPVYDVRTNVSDSASAKVFRVLVLPCNVGFIGVSTALDISSSDVFVILFLTHW